MTTTRPASLDTHLMVGLGITATLVPLNSTMVAVAIPDIADDFGIAKGSVGLLFTVYLVVMLVGQPIAGRLSDTMGSMRLLRISLMGFAALSVATSLADTFTQLVIGRGLQAAFAAPLVPATQSILRQLSPPHDRGRAFGKLGSFLGAGAAGGPIVGGVVTQLGGWTGVFLVNLPLVAVAFVLVGRPARIAPVPPASSGPLALGAVLRQQSFIAAFATQSLSTLGQYSLILAAPVVLDERGWSSGEIGAGLTALTVGMIVMSPFGGRAGDRHGRRAPAIMGMTLAAAAMLLAASVIETSSWGLVLAMAGVGVGLGFGIPSVMTSALESAPDHLAGSAAGLLAMSRYFGSIPASLLFASMVDGVDGSQPFLIIATASVALSVVASLRLPARLTQLGDQPSAAPTVEDHG